MSVPPTRFRPRLGKLLRSSVPLLVTVVVHGLLLVLAGYYFVSQQEVEKKKVFAASAVKVNAPPRADEKDGDEHRQKVGRSGGGATQPKALAGTEGVYNAGQSLELPAMPDLKLPGKPVLQVEAARAFAGAVVGSSTGLGSITGYGPGGGTGGGRGGGKGGGTGEGGGGGGRGKGREAMSILEAIKTNNFCPVKEQFPLSDEDGNLGWEFRASREITITHLGLFDYNRQGLVVPYWVYIKRVDPIDLDPVNAAPLLVSDPPKPYASVLIPEGTSAELINGFRYKALPEAVVLPPGEYYIIGRRVGTRDCVVMYNVPFATPAVGSGLTYVGRRIRRVRTEDEGRGNFGPNFLYK